jgi:2,4-diketo-3-deoxy-L-fuconate hydrolase
MKLARAIVDGRPTYGVVDREHFRAVDGVRPDAPVGEAVTAGFRYGGAGRPIALADLELLAPFDRPGKIVAIGLNYHDHATEASMEQPAEPLVFAKFPSAMIGPGDAIRWRRAVTDGVDYEAEFAVLIGWTATDVGARRGAVVCVELHVPQRCVRPRPAVRRWAMGTRQEPGHVRPGRALAGDA